MIVRRASRLFLHAILVPGAALLLLLTPTTLPASAQDITYVVQPGDNLFRIAVRHNTDVSTLAALNGIGNTWRIYTGQTLILPGAQAAPADIPVEAALPEAVSADAESAAVESVADSSAGAPMFHTVGYGDQLSTIANRYGLTTDRLAQMNSIVNPNLVYIGQELIVGYENVPADTALPADVQAAALTELETGVQTDGPPVVNLLVAAPALEALMAPMQTETRHTVARGEMLSAIARQYGVSWTEIAQANGITNPDTIYAGQSLVIPGVMSSASAPSLDYTLISPEAAPPAPIGMGREVLVDLSDFRTYAYENGVLVRSVLISPGLPYTPTVQGDFTVERKYTAQTMSGPGYYLPDVPYVMYFYSGYALHGTYWHENWGQPMSHGCVNMPTPEAEWFYNFAEVGTPVRVQA